MKITKIETYLHYSEWRNLILIRVETDEGLVGLGEATLRNKEKAVLEAIESHVKPMLLGRDVYSVNHLFHNFYEEDPWRSGSGGVVFLSAVSGLDMAIWDLIGQKAGLPVYQLFGGRIRDRIRLYANRWFIGCNTSDEYVEAAKHVVNDLGFTAIKWNPLYASQSEEDWKRVDDAIRNVYDTRDALGPDVDLCIELHAAMDYEAARRLLEGLREADVFFAEEPMKPDNKDGFRRLAKRSRVPLAAGERVFTRYGYKYYIQEHNHSIAQPDMTHCGGMLETKHISTMLLPNNIKIAPHNSNSIIATTAAAHVDSTMPNFLIQEMMLEVLDTNRNLLKTPVRIEDGYLYLPEGPGLGLEPDWDYIRSVGYKPAYSEFFKMKSMDGGKQ